MTTAAPPSGIAGAAVEFSIVIPCLNEAETIERCIRKAQQSLREEGICGEVIVADNGSSDDSRDIAERNGARVVLVAEKGYGNALMGGIRAAQGAYVIMGDADDSYDFSHLQPFFAKLREGFDLVMGNRFQGGIQPGAMPFLHKYLGNPVLSALGRLFFGSPVGDFHCGLRGFRRESVLRMGLMAPGMEFATELVVQATLRGMRITEVPTTLAPDGRSRPPHLRTWRDGWRHLRFMLLYSPTWLFLYPGLLLMLIGTAAGLWLLPGPRKVGAIQLDVHTLIYMAATIVLGFQSVIFYVFTKLYGFNEGLLPPDPRLERFLASCKMETGLLIGVALFLFGLARSAGAFLNWSAGSFGPLEPTVVLRAVIPAVLCLMLGTQVIFSSFFLGVLGLGGHSRR
jgi:glycosyltransferase involved in cell wall biosynthesis